MDGMAPSLDDHVPNTQPVVPSTSLIIHDSSMECTNSEWLQGSLKGSILLYDLR